VSLVNQKMSIKISLQDSHFQNMIKMSLHCDILQDVLKNASIIIVTLCF
jgi:hypothetical protein